MKLRNGAVYKDNLGLNFALMWVYSGWIIFHVTEGSNALVPVWFGNDVIHEKQEVIDYIKQTEAVEVYLKVCFLEK